MAAAQSTSPAFDVEDFMERVGDDAGLAHELIALLQRDMPGMRAALQAALRAADAHAVERSAHALKGAVANFGAQAAVTQAQQVESFGRTQQLDAATQAHVGLEAEVQRLLLELGTFAASLPAAAP